MQLYVKACTSMCIYVYLCASMCIYCIFSRGKNVTEMYYIKKLTKIDNFQ